MSEPTDREPDLPDLDQPGLSPNDADREGAGGQEESGAGYGNHTPPAGDTSKDGD